MANTDPLVKYQPFMSLQETNTVICMDDRELINPGSVFFSGQPRVYDQIAGGASGVAIDNLILFEGLKPGRTEDLGKSKASHARAYAKKFDQRGTTLMNHYACAAQIGEVAVLEAMHDHHNEFKDELVETLPGGHRMEALFKQFGLAAGNVARVFKHVTPEEDLEDMYAVSDKQGNAIQTVALVDKPHTGDTLILNFTPGEILDVTAANKVGSPVYHANPVNMLHRYRRAGIATGDQEDYYAITALRHRVIAGKFLESPAGNPLDFVVKTA